MSNFDNFGQVNNAKMGSAPCLFEASTPDSLATITTAGYMNDKSKIIKANDILHINYLDTSVFPLNTGENSTYGVFRVTYSAPNWSLISQVSSGALAVANNLSELANPTAQAAALENLGFHSAKYTNAGGSATVTITDAKITATSVVVASIQSSTNAVSIQKVTPTSGTLTLLLSGDPGASVLSYHATTAAE